MTAAAMPVPARWRLRLALALLWLSNRINDLAERLLHGQPNKRP